jgi:hypothetical protein
VQTVWHGDWRYYPHLPFPGFLLEPIAFLFSPGVTTGPVPHHEIIVTTRLRRAEHLLWQDSYIFYANDGDWWHYVTPSMVKAVPECDHAQVRAQCPFYQYRENVYRARCEDGSMVVVSLESLSVVPPEFGKSRPWQAESCTLLAANLQAR